MKKLNDLKMIAIMAIAMLFLIPKVSAQYYVNMGVGSGSGTVYMCEGSTYIVTFTGLGSYSVAGSSNFGTWNNGTPSCINYAENEVSLCFTSTSCCSNSVQVTAYDNMGNHFIFTANFYAYSTTISGTTNFCYTSNETYTASTNVPGVGANDYSWTPPSFLSGSSSTYQDATTTTGTGCSYIAVTVSGSPGCPSGSTSNTGSLYICSYPTTLTTPVALSYERAGSTCYYNAHVGTVTGAEYYDWSLNSSFTDLYETTIVPTTTEAEFDGTTTYTIYVRARNPCATSGTLTSVKETPTPPKGCEEVRESPIKHNSQNSISTNYKIYPNPANSQLTIEYPASTDNSVLNLSLYDMLGQKVINWILPSTEGLASEKISGLTPGVYLYTLSSGNDIVTRGKIIVQR